MFDCQSMHFRVLNISPFSSDKVRVHRLRRRRCLEFYMEKNEKKTFIHPSKHTHRASNSKRKIARGTVSSVEIKAQVKPNHKSIHENLNASTNKVIEQKMCTLRNEKTMQLISITYRKTKIGSEMLFHHFGTFPFDCDRMTGCLGWAGLAGWLAGRRGEQKRDYDFLMSCWVKMSQCEKHRENSGNEKDACWTPFYQRMAECWLSHVVHQNSAWQEFLLANQSRKQQIKRKNTFFKKV